MLLRKEVSQASDVELLTVILGKRRTADLGSAPNPGNQGALEIHAAESVRAFLGGA